MIAAGALAVAAVALAPPAPVADGVTLTRLAARDTTVLTVDPARRLGVVSGRDRVPGLEPVRAMARRHDAVAGVNGGFFAIGAPDTGDPTGLVVAGGALLSEPVGARTAFLVPYAGPARVTALRWRGRLHAGGATRLVDGVNRNRGRIPACGGTGGDAPTQRIDTARTCTDASELVVLTPAFGARTRTAGRGWEAVVRNGIVTTVRRGANRAIPADGYVLSGSGPAGRFLRARLAPGDVPRLDLGLREGRRALDPADYRAVLGGAPRLVRGGRVALPPGLEGRGDDTGRAPRTVAGVRPDGSVLLIAIGGPGATLRGAARIARDLGAGDAVGLDSGGSTTMVAGARVVNGASAGERAVANGLFVLPGAG